MEEIGILALGGAFLEIMKFPGKSEAFPEKQGDSREIRVIPSGSESFPQGQSHSLRIRVIPSGLESFPLD